MTVLPCDHEWHEVKDEDTGDTLQFCCNCGCIRIVCTGGGEHYHWAEAHDVESTRKWQIEHWGLVQDEAPEIPPLRKKSKK